MPSLAHTSFLVSRRSSSAFMKSGRRRSRVASIVSTTSWWRSASDTEMLMHGASGEFWVFCSNE